MRLTGSSVNISKKDKEKAENDYYFFQRNKLNIRYSCEEIECKFMSSKEVRKKRSSLFIRVVKCKHKQLLLANRGRKRPKWCPYLKGDLK